MAGRAAPPRNPNPNSNQTRVFVDLWLCKDTRGASYCAARPASCAWPSARRGFLSFYFLDSRYRYPRRARECPPKILNSAERAVQRRVVRLAQWAVECTPLGSRARSTCRAVGNQHQILVHTLTTVLLSPRSTMRSTCAPLTTIASTSTPPAPHSLRTQSSRAGPWARAHSASSPPARPPRANISIGSGARRAAPTVHRPYRPRPSIRCHLSATAAGPFPHGSCSCPRPPHNFWRAHRRSHPP